MFIERHSQDRGAYPSVEGTALEMDIDTPHFATPKKFDSLGTAASIEHPGWLYLFEFPDEGLVADSPI